MTFKTYLLKNSKGFIAFMLALIIVTVYFLLTDEPGSGIEWMLTVEITLFAAVLFWDYRQYRELKDR